MKISIILPIYNEEGKLDEFIENIKQLKGDFEIIFVDGGSEDKSKEMIPPEYRVIESLKGRSVQMNIGVKHSSGDTLLFLHSDSLLEHNALKEIEKVLENHYVGCFKIHFISDQPIMKLCAFNSTLRVKLRNIVFGDQGIFIKRSLFEELNGYADIPIMEDYELSIRLKKLNYKIGIANSRIYTSDRRFKNRGYVKTMLNMQRYQYMFRCGASTAKIVKKYGEER